MNISQLHPSFEFVFLEEIEEIGFVFILTKNSPYIYLSELMRPLLLEDFDQVMEELVLMDYSESELSEIEIPALKVLRQKEQMHYGMIEEGVKTIADL
jgi:hypothetical protein